MQFKSLAAAAILAVAGSQASAYVTSESFDTLSQTYEFGAFQIQAGDPSFVFTANELDGLVPGVYTIVGDISSSNYQFTSVSLNGHEFDLYADNKGKLRFGSIEVTEGTDLVLTVTGSKYAGSFGNFQGSLVLAAVPEPETYALMLAGLGAVGFIARRRKPN